MNNRHPQVTQTAFCTPDLPGTIRRFIEVFHFADAGGDVLWGEWLARMQDVGDEVACSIWWLCSRQSFFQLEFFHHTLPPSKPWAINRPASALGWTRIGISVPDFDATLARLAGFGIETCTEPRTIGGGRRVCFRDPDIGVFVEILEEGTAVPAQERFFDVAPTIVYSTLSVSDLAEARRFFGEVMDLPELDADLLHDETMEALWELDGARRKMAVFDGGGVSIELVEYEDPKPEPRGEETTVIDQGFSHVAFGFRERADLDLLVGRLEADGRGFTLPMGDPPAGTYLFGPDGIPMEILSIPAERDGDAGFVPREVKLRPPSW